MISDHPCGRAYADRATGTGPRAEAARQQVSRSRFLPEVGQLRFALRPSGEDDLAGKSRCHIGIFDGEPGEEGLFSAFGSARSRRLLICDMGPSSQPAAKGDVLAWRLVKRDQKIIRRNSRS